MIQNVPTGNLKGRYILCQCIPDRRNINGTIRMNIKVPRVLYNSPGNGAIICFNLIRQLRHQFSDLYNAHTTGILKHIIRFKCRKLIMITCQIICNPLTVSIYFLKNDPVTSFDKATPPHL